MSYERRGDEKMMIVIKQFRVKWNQEGRKRIGWAREGDKGEMRKKKRETN